ncbi:SLAM family member 7 [Empidonax traillii]|uniref:SLAM family member 7 n=1 Tax=Empidonax traillii TaxID=164674 RepID=UPI000FFD62E4|nr:SLAM family member 7 [Empidonax traillii]
MDAFRFLLLASLVLLHRAIGDDSETEVIGAVGGSVTFYIHDLAGGTAFWNFGNAPIVSVEFGEPPVALFSDKIYKTRCIISEQGRALTISQLRLEDAGIYSAQNLQAKSTFTLHVYSELAEPRVSCEAQNCSAGGCRYGLRCALPGAGAHSPGLGNVSYGWSVGEQPRGEGPTLLVEESAPQEPVPLTCWARNPVSSRNVTVRPAQLCGASNATRENPKGGETSRTIYSTLKAPAQTDDEKMVSSALGAQEVDEKSVYSLVI